MKETYEKILKPLSEACGQRGRHLICIAPYYDETALTGVIKADLNAEYKRNKDINLVLTVCSKVTGAQRVAIEDLAMLLNTTVITPGIENQIIEALGEENANIYNFFDIDNRQIDGMTVAVVTDPETNRLALTQYKSGVETFDIRDDAKSIEVGYCDNINIGLKESTFSGFYYDEAIYQKHLSVAKSEYEEVRRKCESIGAFSIELTEKQHRLYSLGLKTGLIEVGSTSDISQGYLKDTVDDAVKAAASAYRNGVVLGCNVTLSRAILETQQEVLAKCDGNEIAVGDRLDLIILEVLFDGFCEVYRTILKNVFEDVPIDEVPWDKFPSYPKTISENKEYVTTLHDYIIWHSIDNNCVFDLGKYTFNSEVINSAETDKEILKATIDLLSLLITGNQLVLC
jgi:chaperonin GroEL (HSP60 family)